MASINIDRLDENPHESVHGIREDTTSRGVDLEGATITATYADGSTETLTWQAYDPYTFGGATGANIDMSYGSEWHALTTTKLLKSLQFDLQPASSVFDTTFTTDDDPLGGSTPGSKNGFPFELSPEYEDMVGDFDVTYSGIVNLAGSPAEGDLYTTMLVDFSGLPEGGLFGDLSWNSDIDTMKVDGDLVPTGVTCFARGTLITTDRGDLPIEVLKAGDKVLTQDNDFQELVLPMNRIIGPKELQNNPKLYPIRITAGAMGAGLPKRDLVVSRQHRMVINSDLSKRMFGTPAVLVAAIRLTELPGIYVEENVDTIEYFHLIFGKHEVVFAEGAPTESFLLNADTRKAFSSAKWEEFVTLFPEARDLNYLGIPALVIPSLILQKRLVQRHMKNARTLFSTAA